MANKSRVRKIFKVLGVFLSLAPFALFAAPATVTNLEVIKSTDYIRIIFTIANPHQCDVFSLVSPNRVVVDLEDGRLQASLKQLDLPTSVFKSARSGTPQAGILRIVFDMTSRAQVKSSINTDNSGGDEKLYVDIYPESTPLLGSPIATAEITPQKPVPAREQVPVEIVERSEPVAPVTVDHSLRMVKVEETQPEPPALPAPVPVPVPVPAPIAPAPMPDHALSRSVKVSEAPPPRKLHVPQLDAPKPHQLVVVIDAGHGGKDSGTVGKRGTEEKNVVLGIAVRLAELVNSEPNMHAVLTRDNDYFVTLSDRLALSRNDKADLFIAIHADSYFNNQSTGASVYALSPHGASSVAARWLADRENHSELGGVDLNELGDKSYVLRSVLIDLAQTATISDSIKLGSDVLSSLEQVTRLHYLHVEQAPFMVLKSPDIPSILVETGFLSNPKEEQRLREPAYRDKLARALLEGIRHYAATHPVMASNVKA